MLASGDGIAWVERLSPLDEAGKALHGCLVPGCTKRWTRPVNPRAVHYHVEKTHPCLQLRWTHERRLSTDEESLERRREGQRRRRVTEVCWFVM